MAGLFFEKFRPGQVPKQVIDAEWTRTITKGDNVTFCGMTMNVARLQA